MPERQKILLVEDDQADAGVLLRLLGESSGADYGLVHKETLGDACLHVGEERVAAILLDITLPDSTGVDTVRTMITAAGPEIPIIVLTGGSDPTVPIDCIEAGAQDYLRKDELDGGSLRRAVRFGVGRLRAGRFR
jgi:CheY-like chemotaxis protein